MATKAPELFLERNMVKPLPVLKHTMAPTPLTRRSQLPPFVPYKTTL